MSTVITKYKIPFKLATVVDVKGLRACNLLKRESNTGVFL